MGWKEEIDKLPTNFPGSEQIMYVFKHMSGDAPIDSSGSTRHSGSLRVGGYFQVSGAQALTGSSYISGSVSTTGAINMTGSITMTGSLYVSENVHVTGSTYLGDHPQDITRIVGREIISGAFYLRNTSNDGCYLNYTSSLLDVSGSSIQLGIAEHNGQIGFTGSVVVKNRLWVTSNEPTGSFVASSSAWITPNNTSGGQQYEIRIIPPYMYVLTGSAGEWLVFTGAAI